MSGIYLTVWDDQHEFDYVLKPTSGGWPHVTLAWTGSNLSHDTLKEVAKKAMDYWLMKDVTLSNARVNSFFHRSKNAMRYDVLLDVGESKEVEESRDVLLRTPYPDLCEKFGMISPHVTEGIFWSQEDAEMECDRVNKLLPITVKVTGVTID